MKKDPVCGMEIQRNESKNHIYFGGETIYFCSKACKEKFTDSGKNKEKRRKSSVFARFLEKLAKENQKSYGGSPPKCH